MISASAVLASLAWSGSVWLFGLSQDGSYFGKTSSSFVESIVRVGLKTKLSENAEAQVRLAAQSVAGDAIDYTGVEGDQWLVEADLANLAFRGLSGWEVTAGRQELGYGDGLLVWDGVSDERAAYLTPVRSFWAVKGVHKGPRHQLDLFAAMADEDYKSYETWLGEFTTHAGRRQLYGAVVRFGSAVELAAFYREDGSVLDSDTLALSGRFAFSRPMKQAALALEAELVQQLGRTTVAEGRATGQRRDRRSFGGYLEASLSFPQRVGAPWIRARTIHLPGDDPSSHENEAFDPMFYGFKDWGEWYLGSINGFNLPNSNERVWMVELGATPTAKTLVRAQFFDLALDQPVGPGVARAFSREVELLAGWYPNEHYFLSVEAGYATPRDAARAIYGSRPTREASLWLGWSW